MDVICGTWDLIHDMIYDVGRRKLIVATRPIMIRSRAFIHVSVVCVVIDFITRAHASFDVQ